MCKINCSVCSVGFYLRNAHCEVCSKQHDVCSVWFVVLRDQFWEVGWVDANNNVALTVNSLPETDYKINRFGS